MNKTVTQCNFTNYNNNEGYQMHALEKSFNNTNVRRPFCNMRILETICCLACFITTLWVLFYVRHTLVFVFVLLLAIPFAYIIITTVDHLVICWRYRIRWIAWICYAASGAIFHFLCVGLTFAYDLFLKFFLFIPFLITAILFLFDTFYWLCILYKFNKVAVPKRLLPPNTGSSNIVVDKFSKEKPLGKPEPCFCDDYTSTSEVSSITHQQQPEEDCTCEIVNHRPQSNNHRNSECSGINTYVICEQCGIQRLIDSSRLY